MNSSSDGGSCILPSSGYRTFSSPPFAVSLPAPTRADHHWAHPRHHRRVSSALERHRNEITVWAVLCLISLFHVTVLRFIQVAVCVSNLFFFFPFFPPELNSIDSGLRFTYLISVDGCHLGCFQVFGVMNQAAMDTHSCTSLGMDICTHWPRTYSQEQNCWVSG